MNNLIFVRENGSYIFKKFSDTSMKTLAWFLLYDATMTDIKWLKQWIFDPKRDTKTGNVTSLEKFKKKIFIIPDVNEEDEELEISKEGFLDLINRWSQILKQQPKEIIITKEGDEVTVKSKN